MIGFVFVNLVGNVNWFKGFGCVDVYVIGINKGRGVFYFVFQFDGKVVYGCIKCVV